MKKFTKEITSLLAAVSVGAVTCSVSAAAINTSSPADCNDTACSLSSKETYKASPGAMAPDEIYVDETYCDDFEEYPPEAGVAVAETTGVTTYPPEAGVVVATTTTTSVTTYPPIVGTSVSSQKITTPGTTTGTTYPPIVGTSVSSQKITEPVTVLTEVIPEPLLTDYPPTAGVPVLENDFGFCGDVDMSGDIDLSDLTKLSQYVLGDIDLKENEIKASDCNGDGEVDIRDVALLKQYVMNDPVTLGPLK